MNFNPFYTFVKNNPMTKRFSILLILLSTVIQTKAQNWTTYYGPYGSNVLQYSRSAIEKEDGSILLAGSSDTLNNENGFISEIDSNGNILNNVYIGGQWYDWMIDIFPNDSGYIALGYQEDLNNFPFGMYSYIQMDSNLNITKNYMDTLATSMQRYSDFCTDNSNIYGIRNNSDLILTKFDMYGNVIWEIPYNIYALPEAKSIIITKDGNLLLSGTVDENETVSNEAFLLKLDTAGNIIWQKILSGTNSRFIGDIKPTEDSGSVFILLDGYDQINYSGGEFKIKDFDKNGNEIFSTIPYDSTNWAYVEKNNQGYLVGGLMYDYLDNMSGVIGKVGINEIPMPLDTFTLAGYYNRILNIVHLQHSQGILLIGGYRTDIWHRDNLYVSKIQNNEITWTTFINEQPLDRKIEITCYPNPTQNYINISFNNNGSIQNSIIISDLNGKIIYHKSINAEELVLDVSKYPSGAYIISVNNRKEKGQSLFIKK